MVTAIQEDENYEPAFKPKQLTISKATQQISFQHFDPIKYANQKIKPAISTTSGLPIELQSSSSIAVIEEDFIHIAGVGTSTITAYQGGNENYLEASVQQSLIIEKGLQVIVFNSLPPVIYSPAKKINLSAQSSIGLPIRFESSKPDLLSIDGMEATVIGAGEIHMTAIQDGNENYESASVSKLQIIEKAQQNILFQTLSPIKYAHQRIALKAEVSTGLKIQWQSYASDIALINRDSIEVIGVGSATITALQPGNENYSESSAEQTLVISKGNQFIAFPPIENKMVGSEPIVLGAMSSAQLPLNYSINKQHVLIENNFLQFLSAGSVTITASQPGNELYESADPITQTFCVIPPAPHLSVDGLTLLSNETGTHQWYFGEELISNETNSSYVVSQSGSYKARTIVEECFSPFSESESIVVTSLESVNSRFELYPNPTSNSAYLILPESLTNDFASLTIYDDKGKALQKNTLITNGKTEIIMTDLLPGVYFIVLSDGHTFYSKKIIKMH